MRFDLSGKNLNKLLIGAAIFVALILIVTSFWRRSKYRYPNTSETQEYTITASSAGNNTITFTIGSHNIQQGDLVYIYGGTTQSAINFTNKVSGSGLPGLAAAAGVISTPSEVPNSSAVYVTAVTPTTITVKGTLQTGQTAPTTGTVRSAGYNAMSALKDVKLIDCQTNYLVSLVDTTVNPYVFASGPAENPTAGGTWGAAGERTFTIPFTGTINFAAGDFVIAEGVYSDAANKTISLLTVTTATSTSPVSVRGIVDGQPTLAARSPVQKITTAYTNRQICIREGATSYTRNHCKYIPQTEDGGISSAVIPNANDDREAFDAYQQYITDLNAIQTAYAPAIARAQAGSMGATFPTGITKPTQWTSADQLRVVTAARKADYAGATSKYLATVCPGFYATTGADGTMSDLGTNYKQWTIATTAPTGTAADVTGVKKFYASVSAPVGISDSDIIQWAQYAVQTKIDNNKILVADTALLTNASTLTSTQTNKTGGSTGVAGKENWRYAYANGPGTYPKPASWNTTA